MTKAVNGGIPDWRASSAATKAVNGASLEGSMIIVKPQARAYQPDTNTNIQSIILSFNQRYRYEQVKTGHTKTCIANWKFTNSSNVFWNATKIKSIGNIPTFRVIITNGKFHGVIAPRTTKAYKFYESRGARQHTKFLHHINN